MSEPVTEPQAMITRVASALARHDLDELLTFYESSAVLIRADGSEAHGVAQIRKEYDGYIDKVVAMTGRAVWVHQAGDIAAVRGAYSITFKRSNGETVTRNGNPVEVLRQQADGNWLYVIDHGFGAD